MSYSSDSISFDDLFDPPTVVPDENLPNVTRLLDIARSSRASAREDASASAGTH